MQRQFVVQGGKKPVAGGGKKKRKRNAIAFGKRGFARTNVGKQQTVLHGRGEGPDEFGAVGKKKGSVELSSLRQPGEGLSQGREGNVLPKGKKGFASVRGGGKAILPVSGRKLPTERRNQPCGG